MKREANILHWIGRETFEMIGLVNGLIRKDFHNHDYNDVLKKISDGLHAVEYKAERLAERLKKIPRLSTRRARKSCFFVFDGDVEDSLLCPHSFDSLKKAKDWIKADAQETWMSGEREEGEDVEAWGGRITIVEKVMTVHPIPNSNSKMNLRIVD